MTFVYVKQAFDAYKRNFTQVIAAMLIPMLVVLGLIVIAMAPLGFTVLNSIMKGTVDADALVSLLLQSTTSLIFAGVFFVIAMIAGVALSVGITKVYADALRGKANYRAMFPIAREKWQSAVGASVVIMLVFIASVLVTGLIAAANALLGTVLLTVVIVYLIASFAYINVSIAVSNLKAVDAVKNSVNFTKQNFWPTIFLIAGFLIINTALDYVPVVGSLIDFFILGPVFSLSLIALYLGRISSRTKVKTRKKARKK